MANKAQQVFSPRKRIKRKGRHSKKDKNDAAIYQNQLRFKHSTIVIHLNHVMDSAVNITSF